MMIMISTENKNDNDDRAKAIISTHMYANYAENYFRPEKKKFQQSRGWNSKLEKTTLFPEFYDFPL